MDVSAPMLAALDARVKARGITNVARVRAGFLTDLRYAFGPLEADRTLEDWLTRASQRPDVGWARVELETHVREEHSTFTWLLEPMRSGRPEDPGHGIP